MEQVSIHKVAAWTGGSYAGPGLPISGVGIDSRTIRPGELFVPLRGASADGHAFLGEAFASGAAAALVERPETAAEHRAMGRAVIEVADTLAALGAMGRAYRDSLDITVVGVTGSNGKTTTKEMLRLILGGRAVVSPASYNNALGVPLSLLQAKRHHSFCVVEMGTNAPGEIARLADLARPNVGVVLNVSESHLAGLGDLEGVAREKFALIDALGPDGCAVLNYDDEITRAMIPNAPGFVMSFGTWPDADVYAGDVRASRRLVSFQLLHKRRVKMNVLGVHHVHDALAAAGVALWLGYEPTDIAERLEQFKPAPMRMAVEEIADVRLVNDAYNANPRSMESAILEMSYRGGSGRRVLVLGDMLELGQRAEELHTRLGTLAGRSRIDLLWAIGPLSEATARAARAAGMKDVHWTPDVKTAMEQPPFRPRARDVVLFKASRGVRLERVHAAVKQELLDRRRARALRAARRRESAKT